MLSPVSTPRRVVAAGNRDGPPRNLPGTDAEETYVRVLLVNKYLYARDGVEGLLVEPGDAGDLARALDRLLGDATLRRRLGRQARETAARTHAPER
jgi:hypothetical protein